VPSTSSAVPDREAVNTAQNAVPSTSSAVPDREAVNTAQNVVPSTSSTVPDRDDDEGCTTNIGIANSNHTDPETSSGSLLWTGGAAGKKGGET